jgi:hypothetical protein
MAYPANKTMADWMVCGQIIDAATASICHIAPGSSGKLERAYATLSAAITTADSVITIKKGSTSIGTLTLVYTGSAVGSIFEAVFTGSEADRTFAPTEPIVFDNGGECDTTSIVRITAVMRGL